MGFHLGVSRIRRSVENMKAGNNILVESKFRFFYFFVTGALLLASCGREDADDDNTDGIHSPPDFVLDIDGNYYHTVIIGEQVWMAENLKTTRYRNGDPIPQVIDGSLWDGQTTGAYCNYNNNDYNVEIFGRLYNWLAVSDDRKIAPEGWRVPEYSDWEILIIYLKGDSVAGGKLKETDTLYWNSPNTAATNETGFTARPGGYRYLYNYSFMDMGNIGGWWSSTQDNYYKMFAWCWEMNYNNSYARGFSGLITSGYSVRCIWEGTLK